MNKVYCKSCCRWRKVFSPEEMREIRKTIGLTLREVSEETGYSVSFISDCEHGRRNMPEKLVSWFLHGDYKD